MATPAAAGLRDLLLALPELGGAGAGLPPVRLPLTGNVGTTPRLRALIDTQAVQRLRGIRQLGLAYLVYPGATHTRFEHSLGTYEEARVLLLHLIQRRGRTLLDEEACRTFLCAALLHDIGHYPFSHTLEDLPPDPEGRVTIRRHDERAAEVICGDPDLVRVLRRDWGLAPERVAAVIDEGHPPADAAGRRLGELLAGPLNPDRLDYLKRDSNHVGVPYGRVIDEERLLESLDFTPDGERLAVTAKGVSAVETVIFASYLMYREVYWHHTVRAAQAMLQRAIADAVAAGLREEELFGLTDEQAVARLRAAPAASTRDLMTRLGAPGRPIYRRVATATEAELEGGRLAAGVRDLLGEALRSDYWANRRLAAQAVRGLRALGLDLPDHGLLLDVAGRGKELFFEVPVLSRLGGEVTGTTADARISLVAPNLSRNFDRQAKRAQLLAPPEVV
ncbi:MAG: HD domain-containing protein, partial [Clostridia bacterium]|nr:HD domain-containing protein [Clostridia bacterium]